MSRVGLILLFFLAGGVAPIRSGEQGGRAEYVGGTLAELPGGSAGVIVTTDAQFFQFQTKSRTIRVLYEKIDLLEYGQKVERRYALGVLIAPVLVLSKKRRHFLTVGYADEEGRHYAMVFQVHKDHVRSVLAALEARTGRRVEYQDEEARKAGKG